ncbi:MAG: hypothetical protein JWN15_979, partial [Firmicutes bacterium]|nr:hypothetical protein [Bacillota bacterium]
DPSSDQPVPAGRPSLRVAQRCAWAGVKLEGVTPAC